MMRRAYFISLMMVVLTLSGSGVSFSQSESDNEIDVSTCLKNKDYPCVINHLNEQLKNDPGCLDCYLGLSMLNYYTGNYEEAILLLERVVEKSKLFMSEGESEGMAYMILGITYNKMNQKTKAENALVNASRYFEEKEDWKTTFFAKALLELINQHN